MEALRLNNACGGDAAHDAGHQEEPAETGQEETTIFPPSKS